MVAHEVTVSTVEFMPGLVADVHAPAQPGDYPVVTLTFGRGWTLGHRSQLTALSDFLASRGIVAINGEYHTLLWNGTMPSMAAEVACLAAAASQLAAPYLTTSAGPVWLLGYSAGAHLAALGALSSHPLPTQCPHSPGEVAGMIGLGGPYDLDELWDSGIPDALFDTESLAEERPQLAALLRQGDVLAMRLFLSLVTGATPDDTEEWNVLNPLRLVGGHPGRSMLLITGADDELIDVLHSDRFAEALASEGHHAEVEVIPDADHDSLTDPAVVGDVIATFLEPAR